MDYDTVAHEYDRRYDLNRYPGIRSALRALGGSGMRALELGCGSGEWLRELESVDCSVAGIDPSAAMLSRASSRVRGDLRRGFAEEPPWPERSFDVVVAVNALHHFPDPSAAIREAFRVLRPGGAFVSIGLDPHDRVPDWYVYEFFPETLPRDLARFPSASQRTVWLVAAGFTQIEVKFVERIQSTHTFEEASQSGILSASFTSQLTELTESQYSDGTRRVHAAAANAGKSFRLRVDLTLYATALRSLVPLFGLGSLTMCGGRAALDERETPRLECRTPDSFPKSDGQDSGCRVTEVAACTGENGVVLCPGRDARDCGDPDLARRNQCVPACSNIAYALECPEPAPFLATAAGVPEGCITLIRWSPSLACCPCLEP